MSPDFPLAIVNWFLQYGLIGFLIGLMCLLAIFRGWYFYKLLSGEPEKHKKVFDEAKALIRSEHWGKRYRVFLQKISGKLTGIIGDHYRFPDKPPRLRANDPVLEKIRKPDTLQRVFGVNPFTIESYQFCFALAFLYPILSFTIGWSMGGNGSLGTLELLDGDTPFWQRKGILFILLMILILSVWSQKLLFGRKSQITFIIAFICAFSFIAILTANNIVTFAGSIAITSLGIAIISITNPGRELSSTDVISVFSACIAIITVTKFLNWYISIPIVLISCIVLIWLHRKAQQKQELAAYWFIYTLLLLIGSLIALKWLENPDSTIVLVFYLTLPLVNTPLDWLSLGTTRALLQSIRFNQHRFGKAISWGLLDLGLALLALFLVSSIIVGIISIANLIATKPIVDLNILLPSLGSIDNWRDNLWIYFMLLSTLIPTAIHFALAGGALTLSVANQKRRDILSDMETNDLSAKRAWLYVSIMPAFGFVLAPTLLLYSLYWLLHTHGAWLGQNLLSWAIWLATLIDPTLGHIPQGAV